MKLTDILSVVNPFKQKAAPRINTNLNNPFVDFGGLVSGRTLYPDLNYAKFVQDYDNNSEVYSIVKRISKTISTVPFYVYSIKDSKQLNKYKSMMQNATSGSDIAKAELVLIKAIDEIADSPLNKL